MAGKYLAKSIMNHFDKIKFGGSRVTLYNKIPLNLQLVTKNRQPPNLIPCQILCLYDSGNLLILRIERL